MDDPPKIIPIHQELRSGILARVELVGVIPFNTISGDPRVGKQPYIGASWLYGTSRDRHQFKLFVESLYWYKPGIVKLLSYSSVESAVL